MMSFIMWKTLTWQRRKINQTKLGIESNKKSFYTHRLLEMTKLIKPKTHHQSETWLTKVEGKYWDEYILILRPHIIISNALNLSESLNDFVVDGTKYPEISDLYLITDICITDYSSVMFDFANTKKPLLFFTYDLEFYKTNYVAFYFDFEKKHQVH